MKKDYTVILGNKKYKIKTNKNGKFIIPDELKGFQGVGTALKPALEPICMARKPLSENTIVDNVLKHGTGGINIDESRVETEDKISFDRKENSITQSGWKDVNRNPYEQNPQGRFPANLIHDNSEEVRECFPESNSGKGKASTYEKHGGQWGKGKQIRNEDYGDSGTALKPALEPICMARKPLSENTIVDNVLKWGTGGINIDDSRIEISKSDFDMLQSKSSKNPTSNYKNNTSKKYGDYEKDIATEPDEKGRFPANLIHDNSEEVRECFPETKSVSGGRSTGRNFGQGENKGGKDLPRTGHDDSGTAARYFKSIIYEPKASKKDRDEGLEHFYELKDDVPDEVLIEIKKYIQ